MRARHFPLIALMALALTAPAFGQAKKPAAPAAPPRAGAAGSGRRS